MAMTLLEKILSSHSKYDSVQPGQIIDIEIDARVARDFGGANVVKNLKDHGLTVHDGEKTFFTFDCNPTGSDQKYAVNQQICRVYARDNDIKVFDIDAGIGTHILLESGIVCPGTTAVSTDSHANILGAIGAFGQGMGDMDIAAAWSNGKVWFKVPPSVKINLNARLPHELTSKDIVLNLLKLFGANTLLGYSVEIDGPCADELTLDDRITISSMATEMGAIIILFPPSREVIEYCSTRSRKKFEPVYADDDAIYESTFSVDVSTFKPMVSRPGEPHDTVDLAEVTGQKIDSAFIGSCTNGRMSDLKRAAEILRGRHVAPGVVLKIVPATDSIWNECLDNGIIKILKDAGALVSNAGCAGCAAGQVGQNGAGEVTISTGNRNFTGKQGKGSVYLASPETVAASAIAGFITSVDRIPEIPAIFVRKAVRDINIKNSDAIPRKANRNKEIEGRVWIISRDNIDTDMIFHNRYIAITDLNEMGQYTFDNLKGYENFSKQAKPGDIVITGQNFGSGSSRQQAVDCFISLGIQLIIARSFGAIYERNAINAALPVLVSKELDSSDIQNGDTIKVNLRTGEIVNLRNKSHFRADPFSEVQYEVYLKGGLLG